jgi:group II intron reverse transcriptase/maturase
MNTHERIAKITELNRKYCLTEFKNKDLYRLLYKKDLYEAAYRKIKSYEGNVELDGFSIRTIEEIIKEIKNESFKFHPAKRIWIPKPGRKDKRPIDIGAVEDKVILESIRIILEAIYEPIFKESSHGFRPGKGCHTALKDIRVVFKGSKWFIEGDIKQFFNTIDHESLINIMRKRIQDESFLNLIRKALNAGYYEFKVHKSDLIGVPQGNIISPILSNIYLHEFDEFMEKLKTDFDKGKKRKIRSEYSSLQGKIKYRREKGEIEEANRLRKELLKITVCDYNDPNYKRINYVRYADDWLVGIVGSLEEARGVRKRIKEFLKDTLKIELNEEKTIITNSDQGKALFLGTYISCPIYQEQKIIERTSAKGIQMKQRISSAQIRLELPIEKVINKLKTAYFCDGAGNPMPKFQWQGLKHEEIISLYNAVINGISNYYSFIDNMQALARIHYILRSSAAKLLAAKFKLGTQRAVYAKFGKYLKVNDEKGNRKTLIVRSEWKRSPMNFKIGETVTDIKYFYLSKKTHASLNSSCVICGATDLIEMHHVKHIRKMNVKLTAQEKSMGSLNRKQIPVCRTCHQDIHKGVYDGVALREVINKNNSIKTIKEN